MHHGDDSIWSDLKIWQRLSLTIIQKFTLNRKQRLAFLLHITHQMESRLASTQDREPFRMIIGGPRGTGKSHVYDALRAFYEQLGILGELTFTAPTGVSASNINGSTIHSELSLRTNWESLVKANSKSLKELTSRLEPTRTLIVDEFFFLGCQDWEKASRHINL
ncbi:hypothetical protein C8J56DRAFT_809890, partial [Mycena floridula]